MLFQKNPAYCANPLAETDESFYDKMLNALGIFEDFGGTNFNSETVIIKYEADFDYFINCAKKPCAK